MASLLAADRRALGLFRIAFGLVLIGDALRRWALIPIFYANDGLLSSHYSLYNPLAKRLFSVFHAFATTNEVRLAWLLTLVVYALYTLGYATRTMQALALVLVTSWNVRDLLVEGPDTWFPGVVAAWTLFLPLADRFSIDALRQSLARRKELTAAALADVPDRRAENAPFASVVVLAIALQLAAAYVLLVVQHPSADTFVALLGEARIVTALGAWLHRSSLATPAFHAAQLLGLVAAALALVPHPKARTYLPLVAILFWLPGGATFAIATLPWAFVAFHLVLLPTSVLDAAAKRLSDARSERLVVVDPTDNVLFLVARILARVDRDKLTFVAKGDAAVPEGAPSAGFATFDEASDKWTTGTAAIAAAAESLPLGAVLAPILRSSTGARLLRWLLLRRARLAASFGVYAGVPPFADEPIEGRDFVADPPPSPLALRLAAYRGLARESFAFVLLLAATAEVLHDNAGLPAALKMRSTTFLAPLTEYPRLLQDWNLYADEAETNGSVVIDATTQSGKHIDPFTRQAPNFDAPRSGTTGQGALVASYFGRIHRDDLKLYRDEVRHWVAVWQRLEHRPNEDKLVSFDMVWVSGKAGDETGPLERTTILSGK